jgi:hypothetical protein
MSRLEVPLHFRTLWATGDILLRAEVGLLLKDHAGAWKQETFLVDSGTEMTTMPAFRAKLLNLPMPQNASPGAVHLPTGMEIRSGYLRVRVVGMDQTEYAFPCFFLGDPVTPPLIQQPAPHPRKLLGLSGVIDKIRILFDGDPTPGAPYGNLVIEKKIP